MAKIDCLNKRKQKLSTRNTVNGVTYTNNKGDSSAFLLISIMKTIVTINKAHNNIKHEAVFMGLRKISKSGS
jgi:hypothetical protein